MLRSPHIRHPLVALLVVLGAILIFMAPETWPGVLLLVLGATVEALAVAIKRRDQP